MGKHCEACKIEAPECLCNSCDWDSLHQSPACCSTGTERSFDEDDICSGIKECRFYKEEKPDET